VLLAWRRRLAVLNNDAEGYTVLKLGFPNFGLELKHCLMYHSYVLGLEFLLTIMFGMRSFNDVRGRGLDVG